MPYPKIHLAFFAKLAIPFDWKCASGCKLWSFAIKICRQELGVIACEIPFFKKLSGKIQK